MDKFYRYLREQPPRCVYYHYDQASSMLTIGTGQVIARYREPYFKPEEDWVEYPKIVKMFEDAVVGAEPATSVKITRYTGTVLVAGESKGVAIDPQYLRLFGKIVSYMAGEVNNTIGGTLNVAVVSFREGIAVIVGQRVRLNGDLYGIGYELAEIREMIERVLSTQTCGQGGVAAL
jgi:hypothetical protein